MWRWVAFVIGDFVTYIGVGRSETEKGLKGGRVEKCWLERERSK